MASPTTKKSRTGVSSQWENPDRILKEWATRTPRFLFRGFHALSGGGPETLVRNDTKSIVPHLFGGAEPQTLIKRWSPEIRLRQLSPVDVSKLVKTHLEMRLEPTAFSSWTSDYQTALLSAMEATNGDYKLFDDYPDLSSRHIAVLDTELLLPHTNTEVLQISALHEAKLSETDHPCDFLVYGSVEGTALRAVLLSDITSLGVNPKETWVNFDRTSNWTNQTITSKTLDAIKVAEKFRQKNDTRPDIFLAVLAAELSRQRAPKVDKQVSDMFKYRWKKEEVDLIVSLLKKEIASLKLDHGGRVALVNRSMYVHGFPQLQLTAQLLEAFMNTAWESRWALPPQGHLPPYTETFSNSHGGTGKRFPREIEKNGDGNGRAGKSVKMGDLILTGLAGSKDSGRQELPRKASYFVEAEGIAAIIADALKRIARLNLEELRLEENDHVHKGS